MQKIKLLLMSAIVGASVAVTYFLFEKSVQFSITYVWDTVFNTANSRILVVPLCFALSFVFFGLQHYLDPKSEGHEEHSLGAEPVKPTIKNLGIILLLGYFSLLAGASLGPEAVLVPACTLIGGYYGVKLFKKDAAAGKALVAAAVMALMAAFFHSFFIGVLSLILVTKLAKVKISPPLIAIAIVSSGSSYLVLRLIDPTNSYFSFPELTWRIAVVDVIAGVGLFVAGYLSTFAVKYTHQTLLAFRSKAKLIKWWRLAIVAGLGLGLIYLAGGPLVEFTGNKSIIPLVDDASRLGITGLLGILIAKLLAIGWSRAMGYRGGMIFPMIFIASTLTVISQLYFKEASFGIGMLIALVGILAAEKKAKVLL